jgi:hypothetical protein
VTPRDTLNSVASVRVEGILVLCASAPPSIAAAIWPASCSCSERPAVRSRVMAMDGISR